MDRKKKIIWFPILGSFKILKFSYVLYFWKTMYLLPSSVDIYLCILLRAFSLKLCSRCKLWYFKTQTFSHPLRAKFTSYKSKCNFISIQKWSWHHASHRARVSCSLRGAMQCTTICQASFSYWRALSYLKSPKEL